MMKRFLTRRNILIVFCILSGVFLAISFPNYGFFAWVALIPLLFSLYYCTKREGFFLGFITGFIFFGGLMYWMWYVTPIAWIGLTFLCSIYFSILSFFIHLILRKTKSWVRLFLLPIFWVLFEFLWSLTPLTFGWGILGYSQHFFLPLLQIARITGIYGISFLIVLFNLTILEAFQLFYIKNFKYFHNIVEHLLRLFRRKRQLIYSFKYIAFSVILIILTVAYGFIPFLKNSPKNLYFRNLDELKLSLIQPNIPQDIKVSDIHIDFILETLEELSKKASRDKPDLVVFPESAIPLTFLEEELKGEQVKEGKEEYKMQGEKEEGKEENIELSSSYRWVKELISEIRTNLLAGVHSEDKDGNFHNSVILLNKKGRLIDIYNKIHPVPFGEFVPARKFLGNIGPLRILKYDIRAGNEYTIFPISKGKIGSVICFESALPQIPRKLRSNGAQILFVVTNDGWFKNSLELEEHFYMARIRAVENGVYFVQCANTGISGICAPNGEIINATSKNKACTLSESVYFMPDQTFYSRYGDIFSYICILIFLVWLIFRLPI